MADLDLHLDLDRIPDEGTRNAVVALLNLVERLHAENLALREENQRLKDEILRLNGEQGRPSFPGPRSPKGALSPPLDYSSEQERREPKPWKKRPRLDRIVIHRFDFLDVDPATLPSDATFERVEPFVVQDLILQPENTCFLRAVYSSQSTGQTYYAPLPPGYRGTYGPGVRTLALVLAYEGQMSQPLLHTLFTQVDLVISQGQICRLLVEGHEPFHAEAQRVTLAGLGSSPWHHLDGTPTSVNGKEWNCHTLGNPLYTRYHTTPSKERLCVLDVLRAGTPRTFRIDAAALSYLEAAGVSQKLRRQLAAMPEPPEAEGAWEEAEFLALLEQHVPRAGPQQKRRILEAGMRSAYRAQETISVIDTLVCDDAPQFGGVTSQIQLCWVHEGRHYKKLCPWLPEHRKVLTAFLKEFWEYYRELVAYRAQPSAAEAERLSVKFDELFEKRTGYELLDERIEKTRGKKAELLLVLKHPELPLTNNAAELAARGRVRKRDVSFGPRSEAGVAAWDTFQTLSATARKLGVSFHHWLADRINERNEMPSLATTIQERAQHLNLGASWSPI